MSSKKFVNEEVVSNYGYPVGFRVKDISKQVAILREFFPDIGYTDESIASQPLPKGAEGLFAIPKWEKIGRTYNEAVQIVLAALEKNASTRKFCNYLEGKLGPEYLRQCEGTIQMWKIIDDIDEQQKDDILIVPAQFGLKHRGRSVRRAREVFTANEFGLGAFQVGCMLLTHPERLEKWDDLSIDCAGDEYAPTANGRFYETPNFLSDVDKLRFNTGWDVISSDMFGSASGFIPKVEP